jgi:hypothetical protein
MKCTDPDAQAQAALAYAKLGWPVFPLFEIDTLLRCTCNKKSCKRGKHPRTRNGLNNATRDPEVIRAWWEKWPSANVGILTGRESGLVVLDVDPDHDGDESLAMLEEYNGSLPLTCTSLTGGGGRHFLFAHPGDRDVRCTTKLGGYSGIDLRGDGGYIVAPPSNHESGSLYRWQEGQTPRGEPLAPLPSWVISLRDDSQPTTEATPLGNDCIPDGERNSTLTSLAGSMRHRGMTPGAIEAALLEDNRTRCQPSLSDSEVRGIAKSIGQYPAGVSTSAKDRSSAAPVRRANLVRLSDVEPEEVSFLWHPYLPLGKLTLLDGDPDLGKTYLALAIAADITKSTPLPGKNGVVREPGNVLYMTAEDGLADTLRPRFDVIGGDASRLFAPTGWWSDDGKDGDLITLNELDAMEDALQQAKPSLFVLDPFFAFLGSGIDAHRANETRPAMTKLSQLAERFGCAALLIRHLRKSEAAKAIHRGLGSIDFSAAVRSVLVVGERDGVRILAHAKSNLAPKGPSLQYEIGPKGTFSWKGASSLTADDLIASQAASPPSKRDKAKEFILDALANGPVPARMIEEQANAEGISESTRKLAKKALGIESVHLGEKGKSGGGEWHWRLPEESKEARGSKVHPKEDEPLAHPPERSSDAPEGASVG